MFAIFTITGSSAAATHRLCGRSARSMRRATIACSARSLSERSSCSPRWSSTEGSALRRADPASARVLARIPSRRISSSGLAATNARVAAPGAEAEARRKALAQDGEDRRGVVRGRRVDLHLAREHDLLQRARADALDGARDRGLVVLGRGARRDDVAPDRIGVEQRQRRRAQLARDGRSTPASSPSAVSSAWTSAATVSWTSSPVRARDTSGTCSEAGAKPAQCGLSPPSGANAKPPVAIRPAPRPSAPSLSAAAASARQRAATSSKRCGPLRLERDDAAQRGHRGAVALGLLDAEPRLAGAPRGEHDRGRIDVVRDGHGHRGEHAAARAAGAARALDGLLEALAQALAIARVQRERRGAGLRRRRPYRPARARAGRITSPRGPG